MIADKEFLTAAEVAEVLAVSPKTVSRMVKRGALPWHRIGRARRFRRCDLEDFLARCRVPVAEEERGPGRPSAGSGSPAETRATMARTRRPEGNA